MATKYTSERIAKMVATRRERGSYKCTEETKEKLRNARKGKIGKPSPILGRKYTLQHRERIAAGHRGIEKSEETRIKIAHRPNPAIGDRHPHAILTKEQVEEIFTTYNKGGVTQLELAKRFHVHLSAVSRIINGYTWNHVTGLPIKGRKYKT